ncbi:MAG: VWA domain-containing protein, partial [Polyangiales bacterium]
KHTVKIEAKTEKGSGTLEYEFDANGFGPNCDPNTPPDFDLAHPVEPKDEKDKSGVKASGSVKVEKK